MPIPLAIPALLQGASIVANLFGQNKANKAAKKANRKQKEQDAFSNFLNIVAGGRGTQPSQVQPEPGIDFGPALGGAGNILSGINAAQASTEQADFGRELQQDQLAAQVPQGQTSPLLGVQGVKAPAATSSRGQARGPLTGTTLKEAIQIFRGGDKADEMTRVINALRLESGETPLDVGTGGELTPATMQLFFKDHPSLNTGNPLGL
jgi:hypothetical protein